MKIAVTGSEGFIGRALVSRLAAAGHDVIRIDLSLGHDILNMQQISLLQHFDVMIHLASRLKVEESYRDPHGYYHTNVLGTLNLLETCRQRKAAMIFFSSYLYGHPRYQPIDELHPVSPFNPYAQTKILAEEICRAYQRDFGVHSVLFRPFNIFGPGQDPHFLIPSIVSQCRSGVVKLKDPRPRRDFIFLDDIISACLKALDSGFTGCETYNLGSGISHSIPEVIEMVSRILNKEIEVQYSNEIRENEILDTICDSRKALKNLNWAPEVSLEEGLHKILNITS